LHFRTRFRDWTWMSNNRRCGNLGTRFRVGFILGFTFWTNTRRSFFTIHRLRARWLFCVSLFVSFAFFGWGFSFLETFRLCSRFARGALRLSCTIIEETNEDYKK